MQEEQMASHLIDSYQQKLMLKQYFVLPTESVAKVLERQMRLFQIVTKLHDHPTTKKGNKIFYKDQVFQQGDFVMVQSLQKHPKRLICRIKHFYQMSQSIQGVPIVELQWCLQKSDFTGLNIAEQLISTAEIFPSNRCVCQFVTAIKGKVIVLTMEEYVQLQSSKERFYFTRAKFDTIRQQFIPGIGQWKKICVCSSIPRIEERKGSYIVCDECQSIFHKKCFYLFDKDQDLICKTCESRKLYVEVNLMKIEDQRRASQ